MLRLLILLIWPPAKPSTFPNADRIARSGAIKKTR